MPVPADYAGVRAETTSSFIRERVPDAFIR
jgi:hypothetical protein